MEEENHLSEAMDADMENTAADMENAAAELESAVTDGYYVEVCPETDNTDIAEWLQLWGQEQQTREENRNKELVEGIQSSIQEMVQAIRLQTHEIRRLITDSPATSTHSSAPQPELTNRSEESRSLPGADTETRVAHKTVVYTQRHNPPSFRGNEHKNPLEFLEEFETYCRQLKISQKSKLVTALDCIRGSAKFWSDIYKTSWKNFDDFEKDFLENFWSENQQAHLRHTISHDSWNPRENTMAEHFAKYVSQARKLTCPLPESILVLELMRQFPPHIQSLWQVFGETSITQAYRFLLKQEVAVSTSRQPPPLRTPNTDTIRSQPYPRRQPAQPQQNQQSDRSGNGHTLVSRPQRGQMPAQ